ncbi:TonB-dependent receptor [Pseudoxanthomonas putridarboris]|uniref:TonB-dependent receptor n=1 Tax=Pseudoxanthomonas putridarboris TaxID=752605 RepID=A0ABU9J4P0_9GAMM
MKRYTQMKFRPNRSLLACALASCLAIAAPAAMAQSTSATIRGQVSADSAPATDARVTATNVATGLTRSVQTNASGGYSLGGLPPGTYRIDVTAAGQTNSQNVTVAVGQTATLNLGVGGVTEGAQAGDATTLETVSVTAVQLAETRTSEIATYISNKQIEALPQNSRNFLAFADTAPGMQFTTDTNGNTRLRSGAQAATGINVFIDGVGQKNYTLPGGVTGQDTSRGNPFPQSAIGEYKVITQNYKAEFDQISSAAIVAATRSGSNEFTGDFFWDRTATDWRSATEFEDRRGQKEESKQEQYGVSFGGPIIADRAHFFLAYEAKEYTTPRSLRIERGYGYDDLPANLQDAYGNGAFSSPFKEDLYFGKIDWLFGENHLFELTAKYRDESELTGAGDAIPMQTGVENTNEETRVDLRYQFTSQNWLNDAHITYEDAYWSPRPYTMAPGYVLVDGARNDVIFRGGGSANFQNKGQEGWSIQDDLTFTGWDSHTLKMGVKYKVVTVDAEERNFYNPQFYYDIHESTTQPFLVQFGAPLDGVGDGSASSRNKQFGIYVQDDWEVNDKLTLNLGVRWDYEETPSYEDYVTPADIVAALQGSTAINNPNSGINVNDYISTGGNRKADKNNWAPRVGFSYDLFADQRHVIFGGAGRSYDRNLFDYLQNEVTKSTFPQFTYEIETPDHPCETTNCLAWDPSYMDPEVLRDIASSTGAGREVYLLNNDLVVPYSDQFSLGIRNTWGSWNTEVTLSHVRSYDGMAFILGNRREDGSFFAPGTTWGQPWGQGFAPFGNLILGVNGLDTKANSLYLKLEKPYTNASGWGVTVAYTFTDAEQNSNITGWPGAFDYPTVDDYGWFPANNLPEHRIVATGIYDGPWGLTFSGKLTVASQAERYGTNCADAPDFSNCFFDWYKPDGSIGFKQFDLAVNKEWDTGTDLKFRVRADVLNVFDWVNYAGYDDWFGAPGEPNANLGVPNSQLLPTRTFKLSFGLSW